METVTRAATANTVDPRGGDPLRPPPPPAHGPRPQSAVLCRARHAAKCPRLTCEKRTDFPVRPSASDARLRESGLVQGRVTAAASTRGLLHVPRDRGAWAEQRCPARASPVPLPGDLARFSPVGSVPRARRCPVLGGHRPPTPADTPHGASGPAGLCAWPSSHGSVPQGRRPGPAGAMAGSDASAEPEQGLHQPHQPDQVGAAREIPFPQPFAPRTGRGDGEPLAAPSR